MAEESKAPVKELKKLRGASKKEKRKKTKKTKTSMEEEYWNGFED